MKILKAIDNLVAVSNRAGSSNSGRTSTSTLTNTLNAINPLTSPDVDVDLENIKHVKSKNLNAPSSHTSPTRNSNSEYRHQRVKSDPNLIGTNKDHLIEKYAQLEIKYFESLDKNFANNNNINTTYLPPMSRDDSEELKRQAHLVEPHTTSSFNGNDMTRDGHTIIPCKGRVPVRPSSKLCASNIKEAYIFFKKPLKRFKILHSKKPNKTPFKTRVV